MRRLTLLLVAVLLTSCTSEPDDIPVEAPADSLDETAASEPGHGNDAAAPGEGNTLLAIMQRLGADLTAVTHGIMTEDTALVARSAADVAAHPDIAPEELERIRSVLGDDLAEFERLDVAVHESSVALRDAARAGDMDAVLDRLHEVQRGCVECHTQFRQRLRTNTSN